jgi:hypothetical protein
LLIPSTRLKSREFRAHARLARKATIFFAPFVGEGHSHSS